MALKERLSDLLNNTIVIVSSEGYFKVLFTGFKNLEEIEKLIPTLGLLGIKDIWVHRTKKEDVISNVAIADTSLKKIKDKDTKPQVTQSSDTALKSDTNKINLPVAVSNPIIDSTKINLQVGMRLSENGNTI